MRVIQKVKNVFIPPPPHPPKALLTLSLILLPSDTPTVNDNESDFFWKRG